MWVSQRFTAVNKKSDCRFDTSCQRSTHSPGGKTPNEAKPPTPPDLPLGQTHHPGGSSRSDSLPVCFLPTEWLACLRRPDWRALAAEDGRTRPTFRWLCALGQIQRVVAFVIVTIFSPWAEERGGRAMSVSNQNRIQKAPGLDWCVCSKSKFLQDWIFEFNWTFFFFCGVSLWAIVGLIRVCNQTHKSTFLNICQHTRTHTDSTELDFCGKHQVNTYECSRCYHDFLNGQTLWIMQQKRRNRLVGVWVMAVNGYLRRTCTCTGDISGMTKG